MDSDSELKLISLFTQLPPLMSMDSDSDEEADSDGRLKRFQNTIIEIIQIVSLLDLESLPKPESEFMSLIVQTKSVFKSMDLDSQPKLLSKLISQCAELVNITNSDSVAPDEDELFSLINQTIQLEPEPEFISLIYQILSLVFDMVMNSTNVIFVCPQAQVILGDDNNLCIDKEDQSEKEYNKWDCLFMEGKKFRLGGGEGGSSSCFLCDACEGKNHGKATKEIKHPLHPKHSLQLFSFKETDDKERKCYCCDEALFDLICCCFACDFAMNLACMEKPLVLSLPNPKRHEHPLALFPRATSLICDVCALVDSTCPTYICVPCNFVVHQICTKLPSVIRISRHPHRISFTPSFNQVKWSCGICRKEIHNDYGGYSCIKKGCSYAAHSKCATQSNVWDGIELEGVPEEDIEDVEPFVRISDGIIQHFSHQEHHLRLDENTGRDYNENKLCQACVTPIYFGNLYACMQCDFILHEECANLPRKMYHPSHPHLLTLVRKDGDFEGRSLDCSACPWYCTVGLFYECLIEECHFQVHVQCGVVSEPLDHASHKHPLFLTSKPGERRECSACKQRPRIFGTNETFNCIECDFSLCFGCATLPQKVRYKHDKHTLILSYGEETSKMTSWCEVCEGIIDTKMGYYMCVEDCCVTLHIECTIGRSLYMKPGSSWFWNNKRVDVVPNKQQMTRPICSYCKRRCPKASFQMSEKGVMSMEGSIFCSTSCMLDKYFGR